MNTTTNIDIDTLRKWRSEDLKKYICRLSNFRRDILSLDDCCTGIAVIGETGSGKTSSMKTFFHGLMTARDPSGLGYGGVVLTVKTDEPQAICDWMADAGRLHDVVMIGPGKTEHKLNIFDIELDQGANIGGDATERLENVVVTIMDAAEVLQQKGGTASKDDTWNRAARQLLRSVLTIVYLSEGRLQIEDVYLAMSSMPKSLEDPNDKTWMENSAFFQMTKRATSREGNEHRNLYASIEYCILEYPALADETRSSVDFTVSGLLDIMRREPICSTLFGKTSVKPEMMRAGKLFVINMPTKSWNEIGIIAQVLIKRTFQRVAERVTGVGSPVIFWIDEFQNFVNSEDQKFQATARSCRVISVYMTQNRPGLISAMGTDKGADALLSNLTTKFFFLNSDPETNEWAANLIGKRLRKFNSTNNGSSFGGGQFSQNGGTSVSEQLDHIIRPACFSHLANGGDKCKYIVEGYVFKTGRKWGREGQPYLRVSFDQRTLGNISPLQRLVGKILGRPDFARV